VRIKGAVDEVGSSAACEYYGNTSLEGLVGNIAQLVGTERMKQRRKCSGYTVDLYAERLLNSNRGQNCILTWGRGFPWFSSVLHIPEKNLDYAMYGSFQIFPNRFASRIVSGLKIQRRKMNRT